MVKERPIIMSTEMVKTILDGRKTQTRRVVKDKHYSRWQIDNGIPHNGQDSIVVDADGETIIPISYLKVIYDEQADRVGGRIFCPYGSVGDRLWVKETWVEQSGDIYFKADWGEDKPVSMVCDNIKWRSPLFMPRWASRIILEITEVRAERLQNITEQDAVDESMAGRLYWEATGGLLTCARDIFQWHWDSLNAKRGYSWESNCWVWCISFRKIEGR